MDQVQRPRPMGVPMGRDPHSVRQRIEAMERLLERSFVIPGINMPVGLDALAGLIPVVGDFQRILGTPVLLMGFGLPGENAHAPNEWMSDENFVKGTKAVAAFWDELAGAS